MGMTMTMRRVRRKKLMRMIEMMITAMIRRKRRRLIKMIPRWI